MNNYLYYSKACIGEKATKEEIEEVKALSKEAYALAQEALKSHGIKSQTDRYIDDYGEEVVFKTGFVDTRFRKPIVIRFIEVDCYGDIYKAPYFDYADGEYDFKGLTEESLRAYLMGENFASAASAAGGAVLLMSDGLAMEELAEKLVNEPRTYTLRTVRRLERPEKEGVFYTVKNGVKTDDIVGEMLENEKSIRQQLIDAGVIKVHGSRIMTPEEIEEYERTKDIEEPEI